MNILIVNNALDAVDPSATQTSATISTQGVSQVSLHAILAGSTTPAVTVAFQMSNEEAPPTNFVAVTNGSVAFTDNGQKMIRVDVAARWLQVISTNTGGTTGGALTVHVCGNGPH